VQDVERFFADVGTPLATQFPLDHATGLPRGICYVQLRLAEGLEVEDVIRITEGRYMPDRGAVDKSRRICVRIALERGDPRLVKGQE
jgi:hypothetical protein